MSVRYKHTIRLVAIIMAMLMTLPAVADKSVPETKRGVEIITPKRRFPMDTVEQKRNLIQKIKYYFDHTNDVPNDYKRFDWSIIGGPYYSSDVHFGIGIVASALYRTSMTDTLLRPSNAAVKAQISTTLFYSFSLSGEHIFPGHRWVMDYKVKFQSLPTYFWGIGYTNARDDIKSKYKEKSVLSHVDFLYRPWEQLYVGPSVDFNYFITHERRDNLQLWEGMQLKNTVAGVGLKISYDTRDNVTGPQKGWLLSVSQRIFPKWLGNNNHAFASTEFEVCNYQHLWKGGLLASRIHGNFTYGKTPWSMMPTFGDVGMRGYYYGRYRDKCEADFTLELRQKVWRRNGVVFWVGAAEVAPNLKHFNMRKVLPNIGIGYRWEFKKNVNVRVDFGVGKGTTGFEFNINEAF